MNSIIRRKVLWAEIKTHEQEYIRIFSQIYKLQQAQKDLSFLIQNKLQEIDKIGVENEESLYNSGDFKLIT